MLINQNGGRVQMGKQKASVKTQPAADAATGGAPKGASQAGSALVRSVLEVALV